MNKPSIMNVIPSDISKQDSIDNQTQSGSAGSSVTPLLSAI